MRKAVISADRDQLSRVRTLVQRGRYRTVSEFVREAMAEKLDRLRLRELEEQVERYCEGGHGAEDTELIEAQAFATDTSQSSARARRARAKR